MHIWWWSQVVRLVFRNLIQQYYQWKYFVCFTSNEMCVYSYGTHIHTLEYSPNMGLLVLFCFFFCCVNANFTIDQKMNESLRQVIIGLPLCDVCMMCKCVRIRFPRVKMFPYRMKCRVKKKEQRRNTLNNVKTWISCWTKNSKFKMDEWMDESK